MSIFGTQHSRGLTNNHCLDPTCCAPKLSYAQPCRPKSILLDKCDKRNDCCDKPCKPPAPLPCDPCAEPRQQSTLTAIVNGERVLRPWAGECADPCRPPTPPPPCPSVKCCHTRRSKIVATRITDCGSVIVTLLVNGGPSQKLAMFIDLPQCEQPCDQVAFNARQLSVGDGKCIQRCEVPCEFAVFRIDRKKGTPSGVHIVLCFDENYAPAALLQREGPCCCFVPFCFEFEVWRRPADQQCCVDVETVVPPAPITATDCCSDNSSCDACAQCGCAHCDCDCGHGNK